MIVAVNPQPLQHLEPFYPCDEPDPQWLKRMKMNQYPDDPKESLASLTKYFASIGFKRVGTQNVMARLAVFGADELNGSEEHVIRTCFGVFAWATSP